MPPDIYIKHFFFLLTFWAYMWKEYTYFSFLRKLCSLLNSHSPRMEWLFRTRLLFFQGKFCTIPWVWKLWTFLSFTLGVPFWDRRARCGYWGRCGDRGGHRGDHRVHGSCNLNSCMWEAKFQIRKESRKYISDRVSSTKHMQFLWYLLIKPRSRIACFKYSAGTWRSLNKTSISSSRETALHFKKLSCFTWRVYIWFN